MSGNHPDIVQRLREFIKMDHAADRPVTRGVMGEAADEIERLRAVVADFEQTPGWREMQARIKFLEQVVGERECELEELRNKNGVEDLLKARHYLDKLIEIESQK